MLPLQERQSVLKGMLCVVKVRATACVFLFYRDKTQNRERVRSKTEPFVVCRHLVDIYRQRLEKHVSFPPASFLFVLFLFAFFFLSICSFSSPLPTFLPVLSFSFLLPSSLFFPSFLLQEELGSGWRDGERGYTYGAQSKKS